MDFAINSGASRAVKTLQQCLGVIVDGMFGRNSITAMANYITMHGLDNLCDRYLEEREEFFRNIVARDGSQMVFLKGWLNRLAKLRKEIGLVEED
jgi:lysozyme family protein